jgi:hypothetical protein
MIIKFTLPVQPFSINSMYYATRKVITSEAREWQHDVIYAASAPGITDLLTVFTDQFKPKEHSIAFSMIWNVPVSEFYTKNNAISGHVFDLSNIEKPLLDLLMLPKFHGNSPPQTFKNMNLDDKFVTRLHSEKRPVLGQKHSIEITFELLAKPAVHDNGN